jgi:hypothetical protein
MVRSKILKLPIISIVMVGATTMVLLIIRLIFLAMALCLFVMIQIVVVQRSKEVRVGHLNLRLPLFLWLLSRTLRLPLWDLLPRPPLQRICVTVTWKRITESSVSPRCLLFPWNLPSSRQVSSRPKRANLPSLSVTLPVMCPVKSLLVLVIVMLPATYPVKSLLEVLIVMLPAMCPVKSLLVVLIPVVMLPAMSPVRPLHIGPLRLLTAIQRLT